jgi:hypothetical protein
MRNRKRSRRDVLKSSTTFAAGVPFAEPVKAAAPPRAQSECRPPRQNIQGAVDSEGGALRSVCPEYFP